MRSCNRWGGLSSGFLTLAVILASSSGADTFAVTRFDDPAPDGCVSADCSLREAVIEANGDIVADTITLPAGTYTLAIAGEEEDLAATGDLDISEDLVINGTDARSTIIDGGALDRIFEILSGSVVSISDLTIRNGLASGGGGVRNSSGEVTMSRCLLSDNISNLSFGGGLLGSGNVLLVASTVKDNIATRGGGLWQGGGGTLTVVNSTISDNMATDFGGGVSSGDLGSAIRLLNVTISGNVADADDDGFGSAGGIFVDSDGGVDFSHTLVSGNLDIGGEIPDCLSSPGEPLISSGYNLIGDTTGCQISGDETGNLYNLDPLLSALAFNGGPTDTHALQPGSPAIDAGNPAGCVDEDGAPLTTDQRGEVRPFDGDGNMVAVCDMGAFEAGGLIFRDGFESGDTSSWSLSSP